MVGHSSSVWDAVAQWWDTVAQCGLQYLSVGCSRSVGGAVAQCGMR